MELSKDLTQGQIRLRILDGSDRVDQLLRIAERQNPKRAFLFVSPVLGRHIPVPVETHLEVMKDLAGRIAPTEGQALFMSYAETAIGIGAAIFSEFMEGNDLPCAYLPTTRHAGENRVWFGFSEDHSHATAHHVLWPSSGIEGIALHAQSLVLIDDEATTGNTFVNLINAAKAAGRTFRDIILVSLTDWSDGKLADLVSEKTGYPRRAIRTISLISGSWDWRKAQVAVPHELPSGRLPLPGAGIDVSYDNWRRGMASRPTREAEMAAEGRRMLFIGTGEYVWPAYEMARSAMLRGARAEFLATTRSPVLRGDVIKEKVTFADHYGLGLPMYLHNVVRSDWDDVVLLVEREDCLGIDPLLIDYLGNFTVAHPSGMKTFYRAVK